MKNCLSILSEGWNRLDNVRIITVESLYEWLKSEGKQDYEIVLPIYFNSNRKKTGFLTGLSENNLRFYDEEHLICIE